MCRYIVLVALIQLISLSPISAQQVDNIQITCSYEFPSVLEDRGIIIDDKGCLVDLVQALEEEFDTYDIELVRQNEFDIPTNLSLQLQMATGGQWLIGVNPTGDNILPSSTILSRHLNSPTTFYYHRGFYFSMSDHGYFELDPVLNLSLGLIFYDNGDCNRALPYFEALLVEQDEPSFLTMATYFYLGNCAILQDNLEQAIDYYEAGLNLTDVAWNSLELPTNLAWVYVQIGDNQSAYELFDEIWASMNTDNEPTSGALVSYHSSLAQIYALTFDYTTAIENMDTAIFIARRDGIFTSGLYKQRGDIIMLIYEWNRALDDYNKAIELDPDYAEAYYRRGILYYTMVERENAIADFETYIELESDGQFIAFAEQFIADIQTELDALDG